MEGYLDTVDTSTRGSSSLAVKKLADSLSYGTDRSPFLGSGHRVRAVAAVPVGRPGPLDRLARHGAHRQVYVKEYEAPKRLPCYLLLDTSASMTVSSIARSKYAIGGAPRRRAGVRVPGPGQPGRRGRRRRPRRCASSRACRRDQVLQWLHRLRRFRYDEPTTLGRAHRRAGADA